MNKRPDRPSSGPPPPSRPAGELRGPLGFLDQNRQFLGYLNLVAAILLFYLAINGFSDGGDFLPVGFGIMGLYFFYSYVSNGLKVDFGRVTVPFNLLLLLSALVFLVLGITNKR